MGLENVIIVRISVRLTLKCEQKHIFYINKICDTFCMEDHRDILGCRFSMNLVSAWTFCKV